MNADERRYFDSLTERVLGAIFEVANTLGAGFLRKVYERALLKELSSLGIPGHAPGFIRLLTRASMWENTAPISLSKTVLVVALKCVGRLASQHAA